MQSSTKQKKDYKKGKKSRNIKEKLFTKKKRANKEQRERITRCYYFSFIYNSFCLIYYAW